MPLKSRSLRTTSLNKVASEGVDALREAKSATATRGLATPNPVPVRNQSCAAEDAGSTKSPTRSMAGAAKTGRNRPFLAASGRCRLGDKFSSLEDFKRWRQELYSCIARPHRRKSNQNST